jgi:chromosome segregation and condensation protein ScpB
MNLKLAVEALLFASQEPMSVGDMSIPLNEDKDAVSKALRSLMKDYSSRETALRIAKIGIRYKMEVKEEYVEIVEPVSMPEFPKEAQELLSMVITSDGLLRGEVTKRFGESTERILSDLKKRKIIVSEKYRNTEIFRIGKNFYKYFKVSREQVSDMLKSSRDEKPVD